MMPNPKATIGNKMEELKMKKTLYLTAAILAFAGCAKEPAATSTNGIPEGKTVNIVASLDGLKSTYNKTDDFAWTAGETISVGTSDGQYANFSCTDAENGVFSHTFSGTVPQLLLAVSPAQSGSFTSASAYQVTLPGEYTYAEGVTNALMIGTPDEAGNSEATFTFRHAAALFKVTYKNVPAGTSGFVLTTDASVCGSVSLSGTSAGEIEIRNDNASLSGSSVSINFPATASMQDMTFYIPVPTGNYGSVKMNLVSASDATLAASSAKTLSGTITLGRGEVHSLPTVTLADGFTPYTVGATDNSTAWWGAFSDAYPVADGRTLHLELENYGAKITDQAYHNWVAVVANAAFGAAGYAEYFVLRSDNYGWTPSGEITDLHLNLDSWENFIQKMDGAYVTLTLGNQGGNLSFKSSSKAADGSVTYTQSYTHPTAISGDVCLFLTTDLSHYNIKKVWYSGDSDEPKTLVGYRSGYDYYVANEALSLDVIGTPKRIFAWYSDGTTREVTASDFTFTAGQTLAATEGDQVFTANYKGETVNVTIPVKKGKEAFGSTTLTTVNWYDNWQPTGHDVPAGTSLTTQYFVYSKCGEYFHGPYAHVNDASWKGLTVFRWDNWGWNDDGSTAWDNIDANKESNWNWETMKAYQNHCLTDITWTNVGGTTASVRYDVTYWNGETHYQLYKNININGGICANAAADCCYVVVIE